MTFGLACGCDSWLSSTEPPADLAKFGDDHTVLQKSWLANNISERVKLSLLFFALDKAQRNCRCLSIATPDCHGPRKRPTCDRPARNREAVLETIFVPMGPLPWLNHTRRLGTGAQSSHISCMRGRNSYSVTIACNQVGRQSRMEGRQPCNWRQGITCACTT